MRTSNRRGMYAYSCFVKARTKKAKYRVPCRGLKQFHQAVSVEDSKGFSLSLNIKIDQKPKAIIKPMITSIERIFCLR